MKKLFMVMLGCKPKGRFTEQHDVFFGIAENIKELIPHFVVFWPESKGEIHIDAWREITQINRFKIEVLTKQTAFKNNNFLFFINLGGYKANLFDEFHFKLLTVANNKAEAISHAKKTNFFTEFNFKGGESHIDDKYGVDVDEIFKIEEALPQQFKDKYTIKITETDNLYEDKLHIGYVSLKKLK